MLESLSTKEKSYIQRKGGAEPTFKPRVAEKQRVIDVVLDVKIKGNFRGAASLTVERLLDKQCGRRREERMSRIHSGSCIIAGKWRNRV